LLLTTQFEKLKYQKSHPVAIVFIIGIDKDLYELAVFLHCIATQNNRRICSREHFCLVDNLLITQFLYLVVGTGGAREGKQKRYVFSPLPVELC